MGGQHNTLHGETETVGGNSGVRCFDTSPATPVACMGTLWPHHVTYTTGHTVPVRGGNSFGGCEVSARNSRSQALHRPCHRGQYHRQWPPSRLVQHRMGTRAQCTLQFRRSSPSDCTQSSFMLVTKVRGDQGLMRSISASQAHKINELPMGHPSGALHSEKAWTRIWGPGIEYVEGWYNVTPADQHHTSCMS